MTTTVRGTDMTSTRLTGSLMGVDKRPYPTGPVDTALPVGTKYKWRGGRWWNYTRSRVPAATEEEVSADLLAIFGEPVPLQKKRGLQEWTVVKVSFLHSALADLLVPLCSIRFMLFLTVGLPQKNSEAQENVVAVEEEEKAKASPSTVGPQSGSEQLPQKAESEPVEGVRRTGRKRKMTEKMIEAEATQKRRSI